MDDLFFYTLHGSPEFLFFIFLKYKNDNEKRKDLELGLLCLLILRDGASSLIA